MKQKKLRKTSLGRGFLSIFIGSWFLGEDNPSLPIYWKEMYGKERRPVVLDTRFSTRLEYFVEGCPEAIYKATSID